jgi:hypothetical protein
LKGSNLKAEGVNNVNNLDGCVINTFIFTTLGRRIGTNIHINRSLGDPLQASSTM